MFQASFVRTTKADYKNRIKDYPYRQFSIAKQYETFSWHIFGGTFPKSMLWTSNIRYLSAF